jgi:hypothetical protein
LREESGKSTMMNHAKIAATHVIAPSTMKIHRHLIS